MNHQGKLTHQKARYLLLSALDNPLSDSQSKDLDEHLVTCADCREYYAEMHKLNQSLTSSLQARWPVSQFKESEVESTLTKILPQLSKYLIKRRSINVVSSVGWAMLALFLIAGLVWTIKTLAPIPTPVPAGVVSPQSTEGTIQPVRSPLPTSLATSQLVTPTLEESNLQSRTVALFPNVQFDFINELPSSPENMTVYRQQLSDPVTVDAARQVASQWGINGGIYTTPSEGMGDIIYDAMDGSRSMRFLNFPDQFIYQVGYVSPDYASALMDNGPLPSFDEQVIIATNFLEPFGILDLPYKTYPLESERGMVAFIPLLDGYPVVQEIGVDRSNIGWIDVKVNSTDQVTVVQYSHHDYSPVGEYPILTARQAWERFAQDIDLQHTRYAILSPEQPDSYQGWVQSYQLGDQVDIYGWVNSYQSVDSSIPPLVMINNLPVVGDMSGLIPTNPYNVNFIHAWGEIQRGSTDGIILNLAGWEISSRTDEYITGTLQIQDGQVQLVASDRVLTLSNPPADIPAAAQVGIQGVILEGNPSTINWRFIDTGEIHFSYGASNSCGGGGGGGGGVRPDADFGGGGFAFPNLYTEITPAPTQVSQPYQVGDEISAASVIASITKHLYFGDSSSIEVTFFPDSPDDLAPGWSYAMDGETLVGIENYQNLPVRIWGHVDRINDGIVYLSVERFEPVYPGLQIQAWSGTEQIITIDRQDVVLLTTPSGEKYVINSSLDWGAEGNVIGNLGDLIEIEGYVIPDRQFGGYPLLKDLAGSYPPDNVVDSAQVYLWDHTQDPSSNPGSALQGKVTIDNVELAYDAINLDRCQASVAGDPNMTSWLYVQPMWVFTGHFEDGRRFIVQVQALPDEYYK